MDLCIGYKGEICISGLGLARGYLNRPDLTDSRFLHNQDELNTRVYRTGDLGRWQEDGNLSFEGRMDDQVKVRGYRIELGEIESSMLSMPEIRDVKVMVNNSEGDNEINAFFTGDSIDQDMVRTYLLDKIPAYMIPSRIVHLAEFPRTNNGKIDKDALSKHVHTKGSSSYTSPNTDLEKSLVKIWEEVLQVSPIGVHDNFFELGGHSIKATQIVLRLYQETGSNLSLGKIFKYPTIKKLADLVFDNQEGESDSGLLHLNTHLKNKPNLYMIPPILGSVTVYREFAERMDSKINCIGLQNKLFTNKDELPESVENMAEEFERRILNSQKTDQIFILGYSFGGLIAYDLTKRLELSGLKVKLILVDIPEPDAEMDLDISEDLKEELFNSEITPWLENFDSSEVEKLKRLYFNNLELSSKYTLRSKLSSDILAFEARYNEVSADMVQWKQHTSGNFIIETVDADHFGIFKDPDQDLLFPVEEFLEMYPIRA
ncbi:MAG: thioesterase domain-containing protein [Bacteroidota bacterium]